MYHEAHIAPLSHKQVSKILNGHAVRIKHGSGTKIHLSSEHHKKLHRAGLKGSAITVTLDPYAIEHNQHLRHAVGMGRMKGYGIWQDLGTVAKKAGKTAVKALANEVVQYAGPAAATAFAAGAVASGNPEFAPEAAVVGHTLGSLAGNYANSKIQAMGLRHRKKGGTLLIDQPFTARQAVNTIGNLVNDPTSTIGFGVKKHKPKRHMSEAQKAALAKGRAALRIKLNEMGAGVKHHKHKHHKHHKHSGSALLPAGYGV